MIPTLQTERLTLRPYQNADWPAYLAFCKSERTKYMGGPHTETVAWSWFTNDIATWSLNGFGTLAIDIDGSMLGFAGLVQNDRAWLLVLPSIVNGIRSPELGHPLL